ncbi:hypothetical protein C8Q76DRAFT_164703 [Earliella scabrosa]|nr:hypothetical protein C8Q76DRAFT_164703 [Earliella scabrosa]
MHEGADAYISPRTAPQPGPPSPQRSNDTSLPTPASSDRATTPDSPTSADVPSPSTSATSTAHLPPTSPTDTLPSATSYKEETLLRKDHFEIGGSEFQPRRGTVSFNKPNQPAPATVGFSPSRQERRHISVLQLNRLKREIVATAPKIRKVPSATSLAEQNAQAGAASLSRSNTISGTPPHSPSQPSGSRSPTPQGRKIPPPLKRTWHKPPTTGPPKEPLPSPPASATRITPTPESFRTAASPSSSPVSTRRTLPPLIPPKERSPSRAQGAMSPDSTLSISIPSSPARSDSEAPSLRTPVREDPAKRVLADENATTEQLRDALRVQNEKYSRLSAYLLSLTERHALEKAELMRKVEALEQNAVRCEREMKGLKWLVANAGRNAPARADSNTLPARRARDRSGSAATSKSGVGSSSRSMSSEGGRMSIDSHAGSVEEGLVELQTTISEFIAPMGSSATSDQQPSIRESVVPGTTRTRTRRSNTVPNIMSGITQLPSPSQMQMGSSKQKQARRTSSPLISSPATSSASSSSSPAKRAGASAAGSLGRAGQGLGLGLGRDGSMSPPSFSRSSTPDSRIDLHARCDSSTLSSLPSLSTIHSSSSTSGLSSIPETPRTDGEMALPPVDGGKAGGVKRLSTSSASSAGSGSGSGSGGSSRVSASPSIGQVLDRSRKGSHHQPEMEAILKRLRAFGGSHSS